MEPFKLRATLTGHTQDVRAVLLPESSFALTASRDGTTRIWKETSSSPPLYDPIELSSGAQFKTCLAYVQPTKAFPDGLILSSGQDTIIEARQPDKTAEVNSDGMLIGHTHQVCSLDVNSEAGYFVSGSWDKTARVWRVGRWESEVELEGHTAAVWAVIAYDEDTIVTGCADRGIRVFDINGKLRNSFDGKDIVRALTKLPDKHPGQFASATNDGVIRIWTLKGDQIAELHGHESFIYSLAVLPSEEIVSSGEDRTVRIWKDTECVQIITLPAISVWSVSTSPQGDIIAGSSDKMARIFTRDPSRQAEAAVIAEFEESVRSSAVPAQQMEAVSNSDLPGPEFLQRKSGTREGQKQMIKEADGTTNLYEWSMQSQSWAHVGQVVGSAGSSGSKTQYLGQEYDYVFEVNISDDRPALKLPFNVTQNPYDAATKFLQDNELPMDHLEETANFIIKNTQGAALGASQPTGPDPWGTERRYRPGEPPQSTYRPPPATPTAVLPHKSYLSIAANSKPLLAYQQIEKLNADYSSTGKSDLSLSPEELNGLKSLSDVLSRYKFEGGPSLSNLPVIANPVSALVKVATEWQPPGKRLAGLDLLRLLAAALTHFPPTLGGDVDNVVDPVKDILNDGTAFDPDFIKSNNKVAMMATRFFVNLLYGSDSGRALIRENLDTVLKSLEAVSDIVPTDLSVAIATTTFYLNLAVFLVKEGNRIADSRDDWVMSVSLELVKIISSLPGSDNSKNAHPLAQTSESAYRALMALGTLIVAFDQPDSATKMMVNEGLLDFPRVLQKLREARWLGEPRFQKAVNEISNVLNQ